MSTYALGHDIPRFFDEKNCHAKFSKCFHSIDRTIDFSKLFSEQIAKFMILPYEQWQEKICSKMHIILQCTYESECYLAKSHYTAVDDLLTYGCYDGVEQIKKSISCFQNNIYLRKIANCFKLSPETDCNSYQQQYDCLVGGHMKVRPDCLDLETAKALFRITVQPHINKFAPNCKLLEKDRMKTPVPLACNAVSVDNCFGFLRNASGYLLIPSNKFRIDQYCKYFKEALPCMQQINCFEKRIANDINFQRHFDSSVYLCDDALKEHIQYQDCFDIEGFETKLNACAKLNNVPGKEGKEAYCIAYQDQLECFLKLIRSNKCANENSSKRYLKLLLQPYLNVHLPGCKLIHNEDEKDMEDCLDI